MVNGVALANRGKTVFCLGSDGSQQEGNDAEAARIAVAQKLNVKLIVDDNDVTISGHPSQYLKGFSVAQTLSGHGLKVFPVQGEDIDSLWGAISGAVTHDGPAAGKSPYKPLSLQLTPISKSYASVSWLSAYPTSKVPYTPMMSSQSNRRRST